MYAKKLVGASAMYREGVVAGGVVRCGIVVRIVIFGMSFVILAETFVISGIPFVLPSGNSRFSREADRFFEDFVLARLEIVVASLISFVFPSENSRFS